MFDFEVDGSLSDTMRFHFSSETKDLILPWCGLLAATDISGEWKPQITEWLIALFKNKDQPRWQEFDLLAIIFFLLSRYEEYNETDRDNHDRYLARSSSLHLANCLEVPVVDRIIHFLKDWLNLHFQLALQNRPTDLISTIDVDFPWYRQGLKFPYYLIKKKITTDIDSFDTYDEILASHDAINKKPIFFFLTDGNSAYEKISRYKKSTYSALIKSINTKAFIGIHPPYEAAMDMHAMAAAVNYYPSISGFSPTLSRQHYLRLKLPTTYRLLIQQGITHDFTMGYAERVGFRAGTARSFYWYDLLNEKTTSLLLTPLVAMDVTLKNYMSLSPTQGLQKLLKLKNTIEQYGGNMTLLWHNSSLSELDNWASWRSVYFEFIKSFGSRT